MDIEIRGEMKEEETGRKTGTKIEKPWAQDVLA